MPEDEITQIDYMVTVHVPADYEDDIPYESEIAKVVTAMAKAVGIDGIRVTVVRQ